MVLGPSARVAAGVSPLSAAALSGRLGGDVADGRWFLTRGEQQRARHRRQRNARILGGLQRDGCGQDAQPQHADQGSSHGVLL